MAHLMKTESASAQQAMTAAGSNIGAFAAKPQLLAALQCNIGGTTGNRCAGKHSERQGTGGCTCPVAVDSFRELAFPVAPRASETSCTAVRSTIPRGLESSCGTARAAQP